MRDKYAITGALLLEVILRGVLVAGMHGLRRAVVDPARVAPSLACRRAYTHPDSRNH